MPWTIETLDEIVDAEIEALPVGLRARLLRLLELIEAVGLEQVHEPHVKHIEGKIWELRAKAREGIARGFYVTMTGQRIVVLHVFVKKTNKTPLKALALARERAKKLNG